MLQFQNHRLSSSEQDLFATFEEFGQLFAREMTKLFVWRWISPPTPIVRRPV